jgi:hypothetical protein
MRTKKFAIQCLVSLIAVAALESLVVAQVSVTLPNSSLLTLPLGGSVMLPPAGGAIAQPTPMRLPAGSSVRLPQGGSVTLPPGISVPLLSSTTLPAGSSVLLPRGGSVTLPTSPGTIPSQDPWDDAADRGLKIMRDELVTDQNATLLGFTNASEARDAALDKPNSFQIYLVGLDVVTLEGAVTRRGLRQFRPGDKPEDLLVPLNRRLYPLTVGNVVRSSLTVTLRKQAPQSRNVSTWTPTNWGFAGLIIPMMEYRAKIPSANFGVWIPSLNLHFLGDYSSGQLTLIPIFSSEHYHFIAGNGQPAQDIFTKLAPVARSHDGNPG